MKRLIAFLMCVVGQGAFAAGSPDVPDIDFAWNAPTLDVNGEELTGQIEYYIRYSVDDVEQEIITISGDQTTYSLVDVEKGLYVAQMSASQDGERGEWSPTASMRVGDKDTAAPSVFTFSFTLTCEGDCPTEAK